jgi:two-component system KDP operon response regulator KdpE
MTTATPGALILIVEDEAPLRRFLRASLGTNGYRLLEAETAREALALAASHNPELIVLDLGLPDGDGIEVTRSLREWTQVPIIVVSARGREEDKVIALDAGADDYLTKPFGAQELLARIRVALRHARQVNVRPEPVLHFVDITLDLAQRRVLRAGEELHLTPHEFRLFALLAQHAGKVLTHRFLLKEVWGPGHAEETHYLRVYMAQLRRKLEVDPAQPAWIVTEPRIGYRLREPT